MVKEYHISEKCLLLCACAESTLSDVCKKISDGNITPSVLSLVKKKKNHVMKLINVAIEDRNVLEEALAIRLREHKIFCEEKERMVLLCDRVTIKIKG